MSEPKKLRMFEIIEHPEPGWTTNEIRHLTRLDHEPEWLVRLCRDEGGRTVEFQHTSLHVAWMRAVEHAHGFEIFGEEVFGHTGTVAKQGALAGIPSDMDYGFAGSQSE